MFSVFLDLVPAHMAYFETGNTSVLGDFLSIFLDLVVNQTNVLLLALQGLL
jgi:hypothetical protein